MKKHRPYNLEQYKPGWNERYQEAKDEIKKILGDVVLNVEHIGSTSIQGMLAKPQIDILVAVSDLDDVEDFYDDFRNYGYTIKGRGYVNEDDEYIHKDNSEGKRLVSVHILEKGNSKIDDILIFRDYLRENADDRKLYITTKKNLYEKYPDDYAKYDNGKKEVIGKIKTRAKKWSQQKHNEKA